MGWKWKVDELRDLEEGSVVLEDVFVVSRMREGRIKDGGHTLDLAD